MIYPIAAVGRRGLISSSIADVQVGEDRIKLYYRMDGNVRKAK